jgi:capsule polysaccharide export protein KpsE/RkpR
MLTSQTVADRLIDQFDLMKVYDEEYRFRGRKRLADNSRVAIDKRDGLISIQVDDTSPQRAADIANAYVERLRELTGTLAITEAQQRRQFFDRELAAARKALGEAQSELQTSGVSEGLLRAEPRAAVEALALARSELAVTEIQLRVVRRSMSDTSAEVQQLLAKVAALRDQMGQLERQQPKDGSNYIDRYRNFKYQEGMVEVLSKQYELARLDEQRDGTLIQVVDRATVPEWKSAPKRIHITLITAALCTLAVVGGLVGRHLWRLSMRDPLLAAKARAIGSAWRNRRD